MPLLKQIAARLPTQWQHELKRFYYRKQIVKGSFATDEPEYKILHQFIKPGDWVIDIGANVGHYTKIFSELVGRNGRVIAFEPVPSTFSLLSSNTLLFPHPNVTLINAAVSNNFNVLGMSIPKLSTGLTNYYEAHLSSTSNNELCVMTMSIDSLCINHQITLVKIDTEGHESQVLSGMRNLLEVSQPVLIVETVSEKLISYLTELRYTPEKLKNSPNILFIPNKVSFKHNAKLSEHSVATY